MNDAAATQHPPWYPEVAERETNPEYYNKLSTFVHRVFTGQSYHNVSPTYPQDNNCSNDDLVNLLGLNTLYSLDIVEEGVNYTGLYDCIDKFVSNSRVPVRCPDVLVGSDKRIAIIVTYNFIRDTLPDCIIGGGFASYLAGDKPSFSDIDFYLPIALVVDDYYRLGDGTDAVYDLFEQWLSSYLDRILSRLDCCLCDTSLSNRQKSEIILSALRRELISSAYVHPIELFFEQLLTFRTNNTFYSTDCYNVGKVTRWLDLTFVFYPTEPANRALIKRANWITYVLARSFDIEECREFSFPLPELFTRGSIVGIDTNQCIVYKLYKTSALGFKLFVSKILAFDGERQLLRQQLQFIPGLIHCQGFRTRLPTYGRIADITRYILRLIKYLHIYLRRPTDNRYFGFVTRPVDEPYRHLIVHKLSSLCMFSILRHSDAQLCHFLASKYFATVNMFQNFMRYCQSNETALTLLSNGCNIEMEMLTRAL